MAQDIFASSPEIDLRKRWALMQLQQASDASPVRHPLQAVARAIQGAAGGYLSMKANEEDKAAGDAWLNSLPGVGNPMGQPNAQSPMAAQPTPPAAPQPASTEPRGIRNNNPLNIEAGNFTQGQPGYAGSDGRFAKFDTPQSGMGAADKLLVSYNKNQGIDTINGIVGRWAPKTDGNNVSAYASTVAKEVGVDPNQPLDMSNPQVRQSIALAMAKYENGKPVQMAQANPNSANLPGPPQPNAPVGNRSSVQIPPDVQAAIRSLGSDPRTRPQALQLYMQYAKPVEQVQPMSPEQRKQWNVPEGVSAGIDSVTGKPVFSQPANSVNVNTAANPLLEGVGKQVLGQRAAAQTAVTQTIPAIHEARKALDSGAITGAFAQGRMDFAKVGSLFGLTDNSQISNTEVLRSNIGTTVLAHIKELGANPSNADRDYIEKVQGGQISLEEPTIRRLLDIQEKYARQTVKNFNSDAEKLMGAPGGAEAYKSVAPLMRFDEPAPYAAPEKKAAAPAQAAPQQPVKVSTPDEARKLPSGTPIILPDGSLGRVP